jgi:hypothetical protein
MPSPNSIRVNFWMAWRPLDKTGVGFSGTWMLPGWILEDVIPFRRNGELF